MKKTILATIVCTSLLGVAGTALADGYQLRVHLKEKLSTWEGADAIYHPWINMGEHYNCAAWSPIPEAIDFGTSFTQYRDCSQNQQREIEIREMDTFSGIIKTVSRKQEDRTITETEAQGAVGTYRNWVSFESTYTNWNDIGTSYDHLAWAPTPSNQATDFTQTRGYKMDQERFEQKREKDTVTGDVRDTGEPVRHEQADARTESRTINVSFTAWTDTMRDGYSDWSPTNYNETSDFTQTREYGQHQIRDRVYAYSGDELGRFNETRVVSPVYENRTVSVTSTPWADTTRTGHSSWSPSATTQTSSFVQGRTYTQNQSRTLTYKAGSSVLSSRTDTQALTNQPESRTVTVSWSGWSGGSAYGCSSWSPSRGSYSYGQTFTQSRSCSIDQVRTRSYSSGESYQETSTSSTTEYRDTTGTSDYISYYSYGTWSGWSNSGGVYGCGSWSPDTSTVCSGSSFTQTRSCSQNQTRIRSVTAVWASGATSSAGTESDSQTTSVGQSQSASGTQSCWAPASTLYGSWVNTGIHGCGSWSPSPSTVNYGQSFTQTASCSQAQSRTVTYREQNSATGQYRTTGETLENRDIPTSISQSAVGTKDYVINSDYRVYGSSTSSWSCGVWSPSGNNVWFGEPFEQSRTCTATYTEWYDKYVMYASGTSVYQGRYTQNYPASRTETQTAMGTYCPNQYGGCQPR